MLYIAAVDRLIISNDASFNAGVFDSLDLVGWDSDALDVVALDAASARPRARAPDRPSSTR